MSPGLHQAKGESVHEPARLEAELAMLNQQGERWYAEQMEQVFVTDAVLETRSLNTSERADNEKASCCMLR